MDRELNNIGNSNRKGLAFGRYAFGHSRGFRPNAKPLQVIGFILFSFLYLCLFELYRSARRAAKTTAAPARSPIDFCWS